MTPTDVVVREATDADLSGVVAVQLASRAAAMMPPFMHSPDEVRAFLTQKLATDEVWVAEVDDVVVAYARMTETWLDDLYVAPDHAGHGIGSALLDLAKARRPRGFSLWVFEMNLPARAFYARHGLGEAERTDGRDNEEKMPDVKMTYTPRMSWTGA